MSKTNELQPQNLFRLAIEQGRIPRYLYKYTTADNCLLTINNGTIYFADYHKFNDPFECKANLDTLNSIQEWLQFLQDNNVPMPAAKSIAVQMVNNPKEARKYIENSVMSVQNTTGFLCLTTKNDNLLMWAHYASQHEGCCIKLDLLNDVDNFWRIKKVVYDNNYLQYNYLRNNAGALDAICHKSNEWAYEEEYRVFQLNHIGATTMRTGTIKEVYLGCRIDPAKKQAILDAIASTSKQPEIVAYQVETDGKSYKLNFIKV